MTEWVWKSFNGRIDQAISRSIGKIRIQDSDPGDEVLDPASGKWIVGWGCEGDLKDMDVISEMGVSIAETLVKSDA